MLYAQDIAANTSSPQTAIVTKKISNTVTVNGSYAEISGSGEYSTGETVTINAGERSGYTFGGWTTDYVQLADSNAAETTFTMPNKAVIVTANWTKTGGNGGGGTSRYTVSFDSNGGSTVESQRIKKNGTVTEPPAPTKDGFKFDGWYTDKELIDRYNFGSAVNGGFTLYAKWTEVGGQTPDDGEWANLFDDVKQGDWFYDYVKYAEKNKLMNGTSKTTFEPNSMLSRAMLVAILWRADNSPYVNYAMKFNDVGESEYYTEAVRWAASEKIVEGVTETEFAPNDNITREQIAVIMHRYAKYKNYDVSVGENTNILSYDDFADISEYAIEAMQYAAGTGLIKGRSASTLNPKDNATRAETAAILERFIEGNK